MNMNFLFFSEISMLRNWQGKGIIILELALSQKEC